MSAEFDITIVGAGVIGCAVARELAQDGREVEIEYRDGARDIFLTKLLINAAGLYADEVARMVQPASTYQIDAIRSETMKFYRSKK